MKHKRWHEFFVSPRRIESETLMSGPRDRWETAFYSCFCGEQWKTEKHFNDDGFLVSNEKIYLKQTKFKFNDFEGE